MPAGHSNMHTGIPYPVSTYRHGEVVFQGEVNTSVVLVGLPRVSSTIIELVIKQFGVPYIKEKTPPVDY